jgi:hypothetical protein
MDHLAWLTANLVLAGHVARKTEMLLAKKQYPTATTDNLRSLLQQIACGAVLPE